MFENEQILLAYSGDLPSMCILAWLVEQGYNVVAFLANTGQEDFEMARNNAYKLGAQQLACVDLREEMSYEQDLCVTRSVYEHGYVMSRPSFTKSIVRVCAILSVSYVCHGAVGYDGGRFNYTMHLLRPQLKVMPSPYEITEFLLRTDLKLIVNRALETCTEPQRSRDLTMVDDLCSFDRTYDSFYDDDLRTVVCNKEIENDLCTFNQQLEKFNKRIDKAERDNVNLITFYNNKLRETKRRQSLSQVHDFLEKIIKFKYVHHH